MAQNPAAYPLLNTIKDTGVRQALLNLMTRLSNLEGQGAPIIRATLGMDGNRVINVADPTADQDVVTKAYADRTYGAAALRPQLQIGGSYPLNITNLPGATGQISIGTHTQRAQQPPADANSIWIDSDDLGIYRGTANGTWVLVGNFLGSGVLFAALPGYLGTNDDSFFQWVIDLDGVVLRWTGNLWRYHSGVLIGRAVDRPLLDACDVGMLFCATDEANKIYIADYAAGDWIPLVSGSQYGSVTITDAATSAAVGLALADSGYAVVACAVDATGGAAAGSTRVYITGKGPGGFTINLETAPGGGESVTVDWNLLR